MTHRLNLLLLALLALVALPAWWWFLDNPLEAGPAMPLAVADLRALADDIPGPAPRGIEHEVLARHEEPATLLAAGSGLRYRLLGAIAYSLPVKGRGPLVIDADADRIAAADDDWSLDRAAITRIRGKVREASLVLSTRDRAAASGPAPRAVARGVVLVPAAGGQMVYVRLADGREALFAGEIAPLAASWLHLRGPSRWRSQALPPAVRREVHAWLRTIRQWRREAPGLVILPGRDLAEVRAQLARDLAVRPAP